MNKYFAGLCLLLAVLCSYQLREINGKATKVRQVEEGQVERLHELQRNDSDVATDRESNRLINRFNRPSARRGPPGPPIVMIPGDGGSQLDAKLTNKPNVVHYFCEKTTSDYFNLWLNLELLVPFAVDCWVDNMRLVYNMSSRTTSNSPGVEIRIPGWGNTTSIEYVDPSRVPVTEYFGKLVVALVAEGYERGVSLRGAPYDFRKAPNELHEYHDRLKELIEETYTMNNGQSVILICHSMGCMNSLYFLNHATDEWKAKYVRMLITLAAPWGGAVKALKAFASGDNLGVIVIPALTIRQDERTFPSTAYLMPNDKFWGPEEVLVITAEKNYTTSNIVEFFQDIKDDVGLQMYMDTKDLTYELKPPGVELHCLHGTSIDTISQLFYKRSKFPDGAPHITYGDGDGTVNVRSLRGCLQMQGKQSQPIHYRAVEGADHMLIMGHPTVVDYVKNVTLNSRTAASNNSG